jgi:hypothetical protein
MTVTEEIETDKNSATRENPGRRTHLELVIDIVARRRHVCGARHENVPEAMFATEGISVAVSVCRG